MGKRIVSLFAALLVLAGCMHSARHERAFTKEWANQIEHEREFQSRKAKVEGKKGGFLRKTSGENDSSGSPGLSIGGENGLGVDVKTGGGDAGGQVRYKIRW